MEWANVPYYKKQSIMREIYYDKNTDELNKFEPIVHPPIHFDRLD